MPNRFVILHHQLEDSEHWDLMLEQGEELLTWQLLSDPMVPSNFPVSTLRIGNHRKAYLDYEGPVPGNRGTVRRVDSGFVEFEKITPQCFHIVLGGNRLRGRFLLRQQAEGWSLEMAGRP